MGIPDSVPNNELEGKVLSIFQRIDCEVSPHNIDACHCLRMDIDIVSEWSSRCKDCEQIISVKKDLEHLKMQGIGLPDNRSIFINTSLCPFTACCGRNVFMS